MSDLSDEVEGFMKSAAEQDRAKAGIELSENGAEFMTNDSVMLSTPHYQEMKEYYDGQVTRTIRRAYRKRAGASQFPKHIDAYNVTRDLIVRPAVTLMIQVLADGVQVGQASSLAYKKYKMFRKYDEMFAAKGWRDESAIIGLLFEADEDLVKMLVHHLDEGSLFMCVASGYAAEMHNVNKIWDVWDLCIGSSIAGLYYAGIKLGAKWSEDTVLQGIIAASQEESS